MPHLKVFIAFTQSNHYGTVRLWTFSEQKRSVVRAEHKDDELGPVFEVYRDAEQGGFVELKHYRPLEMRVHDPEVRHLELPLVDCAEARLEGVHPADVLIWVYRHIPEEFRPDNEVDPRELADIEMTPLAELKEDARREKRIAEALRARFPSGLAGEIERLKREQLD